VMTREACLRYLKLVVKGWIRSRLAVRKGSADTARSGAPS
jgi:hypothetical protein